MNETTPLLLRAARGENVERPPVATISELIWR